jgi:hypothetical protein
MATWSWLDVPLAAAILTASRRVPNWLVSRPADSALALSSISGSGRWPTGLGEADERLAEPDECLAEADECLPQLTACPDCGLPAEITDDFILDSTDGPVGHLAITCVDGHHFRLACDRLPADVPADTT